MNREVNTFTVSDLEMIYAAAWSAGAINLRGLASDLTTILDKAREEFRLEMVQGRNYHDHPAVKLFIGHMAYLAGVSLGPEVEHANAVESLIQARKESEVVTICQ